MAEVSGLGPTDPENIGNDSLNALKGISPLIELMKESVSVQKSILDELKSPTVDRLASTSGPKDNVHVEALNLNTDALRSLRESILSASLDITVNGLDSGFFSQLMKYVGNSKKITGLESFSKIFESSIIRMGSLDKYTKSIERVSGALLGAFGTVKELGKGLMFFAGGLALLGFTLITFMEAVTVDDILTFGGIMLAIRFASEMVSGGTWDLAKVSVGIALLGLTIWSFTEVVTTKMAFDFVTTLTMISAGVWIMGKLTSTAGKNYAGVLKGSLSIAALAGSIWVLNKAMADLDDFDLMVAGKTAIVAVGLSMAWKLMGSGFTEIVKGSLAAAAVGGSLWVLAQGVNSLNTIDMSLERGLELIAITIGAVGIVTLIGNPFTVAFTAAGALASAAVGGALWVLAHGVNAISTVKVTEAQAENFSTAILLSLEALLVLGNPWKLAKLSIATPAALAIGASTWALSKAMNTIYNMKIMAPEKYENFAFGIEKIVEAYTAIGGWDIAKAGIAAGVITLVSGASVLTALAINAFAKISASPDAVDNAVLSLDRFVTGIASSFDRNKERFEAIGPGIRSFFGLSTMVKEIAESVQAISNLEFYDKEIRNGKVVITGVRKFTPADFANVGVSIGRILSALTDPLAQLGSKKDSFSIGGFSITNPFSNKVQEGIQAMTGVGAVFNPIANIVKTFAENDIDKPFIDKFNLNLASVLQGIGHAFSTDNVQINRENVTMIGLASLSLNGIMNRIMNNKFEKASTNFGKFSKDLAVIKNSLNGMDLAKLTKFNSVLSHLNDLQKSNSMKELVEAFREFIETFVSYTERNTGGQTSSYAPEPVSNNFFNTNPTPTATKTKSSIIPIENNAQNNEEVVKMLQQLYDLMASGNLKVKTSPQGAW